MAGAQGRPWGGGRSAPSGTGRGGPGRDLPAPPRWLPATAASSHPTHHQWVQPPGALSRQRPSKILSEGRGLWRPPGDPQRPHVQPWLETRTESLTSSTFCAHFPFSFPLLQFLVPSISFFSVLIFRVSRLPGSLRAKEISLPGWRREDPDNSNWRPNPRVSQGASTG